MGYSRSEVTLRRRIKDYPEFFAALASGRPARLVVPENTAHKKAYAIREALHVASLFPGQYPELALADKRFAIEVLSGREIQARPKEGPTASAVETIAATPEQGRETQGAPAAPQTVAGLKTATDIISYCIRRLPTNDAFYFPDAELSEAELAKLYRWCRTLTPRRVIVRPRGTKALTITNKNPEIPSSAIWRPDGTPNEEL